MWTTRLSSFWWPRTVATSQLASPKEIENDEMEREMIEMDTNRLGHFLAYDVVAFKACIRDAHDDIKEELEQLIALRKEESQYTSAIWRWRPRNTKHCSLLGHQMLTCGRNSSQMTRMMHWASCCECCELCESLQRWLTLRRLVVLHADRRQSIYAGLNRQSSCVVCVRCWYYWIIVREAGTAAPAHNITIA